MRDIGSELKALRLYGMASAWDEIAARDNDLGMQTARGLIERLLEAEATDRAMRSIRYQLNAARFPGRLGSRTSGIRLIPSRFAGVARPQASASVG